MVFRAVAEAKPRTLLLVADGPRSSRPDEGSLCAQVRSIATQVDWPCKVLTNFSDTTWAARKE